ncbi:hypothetical protein V1477_003591 [Vespula maculifrons]|uniref:Uncharacterized protein n=1 Tax=Vespula maculifrons TaxID=7453 RepID=A0ABD2CTH3_VESMC
MQKYDSILIHTGYYEIDQATINLALREDCKIFTTMVTPKKHRFLKETFPSINENHIENS